MLRELRGGRGWHRQGRGSGRERRVGRLAPEAQEQPGEAALLLHRPHHHVHPPEPAEETHPQRDLRVHQQPLPVLPGEVPGVAKLHPPQLVPERLLCENPTGARQPRQGQLLDPGPRVGGHVRQRQLPQEEETVQAGSAGHAQGPDRAHDAKFRRVQPRGPLREALRDPPGVFPSGGFAVPVHAPRGTHAAAGRPPPALGGAEPKGVQLPAQPEPSDAAQQPQHGVHDQVGAVRQAVVQHREHHRGLQRLLVLASGFPAASGDRAVGPAERAVPLPDPGLRGHRPHPQCPVKPPLGTHFTLRDDAVQMAVTMTLSQEDIDSYFLYRDITGESTYL